MELCSNTVLWTLTLVFWSGFLMSGVYHHHWIACCFSECWWIWVMAHNQAVSTFFGHKPLVPLNRKEETKGNQVYKNDQAQHPASSVHGRNARTMTPPAQRCRWTRTVGLVHASYMGYCALGMCNSPISFGVNKYSDCSISQRRNLRLREVSLLFKDHRPRGRSEMWTQAVLTPRPHF